MTAKKYAEEIVRAYEELWEFIEGKREWNELSDKDFARLSCMMGKEGRQIWVQDHLEGLVTISEGGTQK